LISWIKGEFICSWLNNQKYFLLINCHGLGYEIQTPYLIDKDLNNQLTLWLHYIKREDSDSFYGFKNKDERDFFRDLLNVKGIGPQIGMSLFNKYSLNDVIYALSTDNRKLINAVPGIGQKMTERIFLELRNKINIKYKSKQINNKFSSNRDELEIIIEDVKIALKSLDYSKKDIHLAITNLLNDYTIGDDANTNLENIFTFEELFKKSLNLLESN
tara:strand:+ start:24368 stop:25015 length:648 start_codon:yes stop_codon:yes gene_type:complete